MPAHTCSHVFADRLPQEKLRTRVSFTRCQVYPFVRGENLSFASDTRKRFETLVVPVRSVKVSCVVIAVRRCVSERLSDSCCDHEIGTTIFVPHHKNRNSPAILNRQPRPDQQEVKSASSVHVLVAASACCNDGLQPPMIPC